MRSALKKIIIITLSICIGLAVIMQGCAPSSAKGIVSIEKTASIGLTDTYTIYYTDGSTQEFTITNGKDGKDGDERPISIDDAYAKYKEAHPSATVDDFLREYLSITYDTDVRGIVSIEKTATEGVTDTYTITFTDQTHQTITITNGTNGEDGQSVTVDDIFNKYKETHPTATFEEFLSDYLTFGGDNARIINQAVLSQVSVYTTYLTSSSGYPERKISSGSGIIYKTVGEYTYLITNCHVVFSSTAEGFIAETVHFYLYGSEGSPYTNGTDEQGRTVYSFSGNVIDASVVGISKSADIAVIKARTEDISAINANYVCAEFASSYHVGETAIAIGNSLSKGLSVTQGIICVDSEDITLNYTGQATKHREFRIDTALWHGNSGGGVFNAQGKLIGVANSGDEDENMFYAVPLSVAENTADNIIFYEQEGQVVIAQKIYLGIVISSKNAKFVLDQTTGLGNVVNEITLSEIYENNIASYLGLEIGDRIIAFNINERKVTLNSNYNLGDAILTVRVGDVISFDYERDGVKSVSLTYTVTENDLIDVN